jgi:hypothetical protein
LTVNSLISMILPISGFVFPRATAFGCSKAQKDITNVNGPSSDSIRVRTLSWPSELGVGWVSAAAETMWGELLDMVGKRFVFPDGLRTVGDVEFFEHTLEVVLDRELTDLHDFADFGVCFS